MLYEEIDEAKIVGRSRLAEKKKILLQSGILIPYLLWAYGLENVSRVFRLISQYLPIPTRPIPQFGADVIDETKETIKQAYIARTLTGRPIHLTMATGYVVPDVEHEDFGSSIYREAEELFWALRPLKTIYQEAIRKHIIQAKLELEVVGRRLSPERILTFAPSYNLSRVRLRIPMAIIDRLALAARKPNGSASARAEQARGHWPVTGSSEIASGYRSWYAAGGCTPPMDKLVQRGESLLVDMHPTYKQYYSDLSHNYILGEPSTEQRKLADAYLAACETLVASLKAGSTIGDVFKKVSDELERSDYRRYTLPGFGHGLGVVGHEWHPPIIDSDEVRDLVLQEDVVEVAAMVINVPDVGGMRLECPVRVTPSGGEMLTTTPLELTVLDLQPPQYARIRAGLSMVICRISSADTPTRSSVGATKLVRRQ
jgi:hypothetical protein